ncbi:septal ring lytic transglycosylase RlpA family protein [candidate division KSB1 bacterium]
MNAPSLKTYNGLASWYGPKFNGRKTANGETYDMYKISAAHKELPFNTWVRVTNKKNGKKLLVRINDRGPFIKGRILDLSYGAALELDTIRDGVVDVKIEVVKWGNTGRFPFELNRF